MFNTKFNVMKKTLMIPAIFVVLLLTVSANTDRVYNAAEGIEAPKFEVKASDGTIVKPTDTDGRFVIVNFWASSDAGSRIAANLYDSYVEDAGEDQISLVSINFDDNEKLFREIVRRDGLRDETQYNVADMQRNEIIRRYALESGLKSFLINPEGVIVSVNPTIDQLTLLMK